MIPVTMPVFSATNMYGDEKFRLVADGGFRPFFKYPICETTMIHVDVRLISYCN